MYKKAPLNKHILEENARISNICTQKFSIKQFPTQHLMKVNWWESMCEKAVYVQIWNLKVCPFSQHYNITITLPLNTADQYPVRTVIVNKNSSQYRFLSMVFILCFEV